MKNRTLWTVFLFSFLGYIIILFWIWINPIEKNNYMFEGKGTRSFPYKINSVEDLEQFRDLVNNGEGFSHIYFEQTTDLDLSNVENWVSIGVYGGNRYFHGIYNGAGHTISNLVSINEGNTGLFGMLCGEVWNLGIESGYINGLHVGSITSHGSDSAAIINCYNKAMVHGVYRAGGIADNLGEGRIEHCWNLGEVSADSGMNYGISSYSAAINNCYCINLTPAPQPGCLVDNTITFTAEELKNIEDGQTIFKIDEDNSNSIKVFDDTIFFEQKDRYTTIIQWLKASWILLVLLACSMSLYIIVNVSNKKNMISNVEKKVEPSFVLDSVQARSDLEKRKRGCCTVCFLLIWFLGTGLINKTLELKRDDGVVTMQNYHRQPEESVDVLFLGSSRVGMNLDLETLWKYYGISSYACWGSVQPFWNSYYFLKDATDSSRPKVVVLEVSAATYSYEYSDDGRQYTNTYGLKTLLNKIQAVQVSAPQKRWGDLLLGYPIYHMRYSELVKADFVHYFWNNDAINYKGNSVRYGVGDYNLEDVSEITEIERLYSKEEDYLRKSIEYCQNERIPILLIATPNPARSGEQPYFNAVQEIADEYKVPFINFNLLDAETGFTADDFWTDGHHLNTSGGRKISSYLGKYLMSKYMLLDHRGDENYKSWDVFADNMENSYLKLITEADDYFSEIARNGRTVVIVKQNIQEQSETYHSFLLKTADTGLNLSFLADEGQGCYVIDTFGSKQYDCTQDCHLRIDGIDMTIDFAHSSTVFIDGSEAYELPGSGIICMVYDPLRKEIVDIAVLSEDTQYAVIHQ